MRREFYILLDKVSNIITIRDYIKGVGRRVAY